MYKESVVVVQETSPNEINILKRFHTKFEISKSAIQSFMRPLRPSSKHYLDEVGEPGKSLVKEIMALKGVTEIFIEPYEICVKISLAFGFDEIIPKVLDILKKYTPEDILKEKRPFVSYTSYQDLPVSKVIKRLRREENFSRVKYLVFKPLWSHIRNSFHEVTNWVQNIFK